MAEVLSQSEIDALLSAVSTGSVETAPDEPASGGAQNDWIAYDLTSQEKIYRGRLAGLEGIHDRFARLFRVTLSNHLKKNVSVNCTNTDFLRFGDYITNILLPASLNVITLPKLQGHFIFLVTSKLTYALVDAYYGGSERPYAKLGGRDEFTAIENRMIRTIIQLALNDLREAWRLNYKLDCELQRMESNPAFVGSIHSSELVAVVNFEVEFENLSGPLILILQLRALDPIQQSLSVNIVSELDVEATTWRAHWMRELSEIALEARVELGATARSLKDVQNWKPGDVIPLTQDAASPLPVYLENLLKIQGLMGSYRGNNAVRIVSPAERGSTVVHDETSSS